MKKGKRLNIKINFSNRWLYTIIAIGILAMIGVGVYALTPGTAPNPGHLISEMAPPSPCATNQYLQFDGTNWKCSTVTSVICPTGMTPTYTYSNSAEDTYTYRGACGGGSANPRCPTDSCDGSSSDTSRYTCPVSAESSCTDVYAAGGLPYAYYDITCRRYATISCVE
jgi:hypothetical protein